MASTRQAVSTGQAGRRVASICQRGCQSPIAILSLLLVYAALFSVSASPPAIVPHSSMRLRGGLGQDSSTGWPGGGADGGGRGVPPQGNFAGLDDEGVTPEEMAEIQSSVMKMHEVSAAETKRYEQELR
jgi:hypothetical protein